MKKTAITSDRIPNPYGYYPLATRAGILLFLSLQLPVSPLTQRIVRGYSDLREEDRERARKLSLHLLALESREGRATAQVWQCYAQLAALLQEVGSSIDNTIYTYLFLTDVSVYPCFFRARRAFFEPRVPPGSTSALIGALPHPEAMFGLDGFAFVPDGSRPDERMVAINESRHYRQHLKLSDFGLAARVGPLLFVSGVLAVDPESGVFVGELDDLGHEAKDLSTGSPFGDAADGPILAQAQFNYRMLQGLLEENGSSLGQVLKTVIYMTDMRCLPVLERLSRRVFGGSPPAVTICGTSQQAPRGVLMEVDAIAVIPDAPGAPSKEAFSHREIFPETGYRAGVTKAGQLLFASAILPVDVATGRVVQSRRDLRGREGTPTFGSLLLESLEGPVVCQAWHLHDMLRAILLAHGASMRDVLKVNLYLRDMGHFPAVDRVARTFFQDSPPAITVIQAASLPLPDALLQMDAIALVPEAAAPRGPSPSHRRES